MNEASVRTLLDALADGGIAARFVGGCVRDWVLGRPISDIDIAVDKPPETVMKALEAADIKVVPTGLKHGTVTAIVKSRPFEITTLRRDVETDGRHAIVAFTDDWREDASRRDFTFNALYADRAGTIYDYFDGQTDLKAGRVRFIGDPEQRIAEDRLRVLRFFRFHARFGKPPFDGPSFDACRRNAATVNGLSGERVAQGAFSHARRARRRRCLRRHARSGRARSLAARICRQRQAARAWRRAKRRPMRCAGWRRSCRWTPMRRRSASG